MGLFFKIFPAAVARMERSEIRDGRSRGSRIALRGLRSPLGRSFGESMTAHLNVVTIGVTDFARSVRFYSGSRFRAPHEGDRRRDRVLRCRRADPLVVPLGQAGRRMRRSRSSRGRRRFAASRLRRCAAPTRTWTPLMSRALAAGATLLKHAHEDGVRRLFGLFRRSGRPRLGGRARAGLRVHRRRARDLAGLSASGAASTRALQPAARPSLGRRLGGGAWI